MSPDISEVVQDRRFCIGVVVVIVTIIVVYTASIIYQLYITWQAALDEGIPITMDFNEIIGWFTIVVGYPALIMFIIAMYLYFILMFARLRRS